MSKQYQQTERETKKKHSCLHVVHCTEAKRDSQPARQTDRDRQSHKTKRKLRCISPKSIGFVVSRLNTQGILLCGALIFPFLLGAGSVFPSSEPGKTPKVLQARLFQPEGMGAVLLHLAAWVKEREREKKGTTGVSILSPIHFWLSLSLFFFPFGRTSGKNPIGGLFAQRAAQPIIVPDAYPPPTLDYLLPSEPTSRKPTGISNDDDDQRLFSRFPLPAPPLNRRRRRRRLWLTVALEIP